ncbi:methyltransferase domain-containing protein [Halovenus sp. WSH3]|uniref:Methyltransferase domain-containing protein n=1 Tax=Halovenus carboxidivorans TaxID=2692199 RepID=A0A6B0T7D1_9EURY|nr:class I SAM-dependent methyltransferase [Halovenus carboxidivorans]MXR52116.1 methyltransferase domain-containing protein [Halovenus carboxidivorans]
MGFHTFDPEMADRLEEPTRFRFCSREELLQWLPTGADSRILDIGSGTGFYTDEVAPFVGSVVALDVQAVMHERYRERGLPETVGPVTADAGRLPFSANTFDGAFSTMTFHESATEQSVSELYRVLAPDGQVVIVDWTASGDGESGPPLSERYDLDQARTLLSEAGFEIEVAATRSETFALVGHK